MFREAVIRCIPYVALGKIQSPAIITLHGNETNVIKVGCLDGGFNTEGTIRHEAFVVCDNNVVMVSIKSKREVSASTDFNHAINREVFWIVFEIVPCLWHDVAHVC